MLSYMKIENNNIIMKKNIILFGSLAMFALTACNNSSENKTVPIESPAPAPTPATPEKTTVTVEPSSQKEGTTIKMNDQGLSIENKDGSKKNNVKISKDSTNIEISRPK